MRARIPMTSDALFRVYAQVFVSVYRDLDRARFITELHEHYAALMGCNAAARERCTDLLMSTEEALALISSDEER